MTRDKPAGELKNREESTQELTGIGVDSHALLYKAVHFDHFANGGVGPPLLANYLVDFLS